MAERKIAWKPRNENVLIGTDIPRIDGVDKASGHAKYASDMNTKGTLYAKVLTCPHGHARIAKLNVEPAKKVKGVHSVHIFKNEGAECRYDGELIAAVAAERGASSPALMAIFGWTTLKGAERYTRAADQQRLADEHMALIVPLSEPVEAGGTIKKKSLMKQRPNVKVEARAGLEPA